MGKPRVTDRPLTSAGFGGPGLPFDPRKLAVKDELPAKLAGITEIDLLERLQEADGRKTAAAVYQHRIDELTTTASGQE